MPIDKESDDIDNMLPKEQLFPPAVGTVPGAVETNVGLALINPKAMTAQDFLDLAKNTDGSPNALAGVARKLKTELRTMLNREEIQAELARLRKDWKIDAKDKTELVRAKLAELAFDPHNKAEIQLAALQAIGKDPEVGIYAQQPNKIDVNILQYSPEVEKAIMAAEVIDVEAVVVPPSEETKDV